MDFAFNEDQRMLADSIDRFLTDRHGLAARERLMADPAARAAFWREIAEMGWIGAAFPEAFGGFGQSPVDVLVVMERFGRHLVTAPYLIGAVVCGRLLIDGLDGEARASLISAVIAGDLRLALAAGAGHVLRSAEHHAFVASAVGTSYRLDGSMSVVIGADDADRLIVAARTAGANGDREGLSLFLVDPSARGVLRRAFRMIDGHGAAEIVLEGAEVSGDALMGPLGGAVPLIEKALDHGIAAITAEALGSMAYLVPTTADYIKTRQQYGAPLAKFQSLQHRMADMYVATETARSMAYVASLSLDQCDDARSRDLSAAKAQVGRSGKYVGYHAVQLHGGMGVSEELDIGHHHIRLTAINQWFGDIDFHLFRYADASDRIALQGAAA